MEKFQEEAVKIGITVDQALSLTHPLQLRALKAGATYEQALHFMVLSQVEAFKNGVPYIKAIKYPKCTPFEEANIQLARFRCDPTLHNGKDTDEFYWKCIRAFENEICETSDYRCHDMSCMDNLDGTQYVCIKLLGCPSNSNYMHYQSVYHN
ncbi:hypothetical protein NOVO_08455 [Rickettsiales bacterium Ac37b]|nr:hypothetical protein NOVO_08455 [Rickettsiales bacterium Ac37b]